jgi:hypothetical protein
MKNYHEPLEPTRTKIRATYRDGADENEQLSISNEQCRCNLSDRDIITLILITLFIAHCFLYPFPVYGDGY